MRDEEIVARQIGRRPRGFLRVATRCPLGLPETIVTRPIVSGVADGRAGLEPFPTVFWLTCPGAVRAVSELEAQGHVRKLQERLAADPGAAEAHREAARSYADLRLSLLGRDDAAHLARDHTGEYEVVAHSGVGGVLGEPGKGGIKCLHAHYADYLARGVNPVGRWVHELLREKAHSREGSGCGKARG